MLSDFFKDRWGFAFLCVHERVPRFGCQGLNTGLSIFQGLGLSLSGQTGFMGVFRECEVGA